jgi:hypothetical protein
VGVLCILRRWNIFLFRPRDQHVTCSQNRSHLAMHLFLSPLPTASIQFFYVVRTPYNHHPCTRVYGIY